MVCIINLLLNPLKFKWQLEQDTTSTDFAGRFGANCRPVNNFLKKIYLRVLKFKYHVIRCVVHGIQVSAGVPAGEPFIEQRGKCKTQV
jgi:hypothetical protein